MQVKVREPLSYITTNPSHDIKWIPLEKCVGRKSPISQKQIELFPPNIILLIISIHKNGKYYIRYYLGSKSHSNANRNVLIL